MSEFAYPLDGNFLFSAKQAGTWLGTRTSGVWSGDDNLRVSVASARQLKLSPGIAWINTEQFWGKVYCNTADILFNLPTADGVLDRICRVVIRWDKTANKAEATLLLGTPASTPVAPARSTTDELYDLVIADYLIQHGETTASAARLTDQRMNEELCGLMRDGVTRLPTAGFQAQIDAEIDEVKTLSRATLDAIESELAELEAGTAVELKKRLFRNTSAPVSAFVADTTYSDYPFRAAIALDGVLSNMIPEVMFDVPDAVSGNYSPVSDTYDGGVYIYAASKPDAAITIPTIICWRGA